MPFAIVVGMYRATRATMQVDQWHVRPLCSGNGQSRSRGRQVWVEQVLEDCRTRCWPSDIGLVDIETLFSDYLPFYGRWSLTWSPWCWCHHQRHHPLHMSGRTCLWQDFQPSWSICRASEQSWSRKACASGGVLVTWCKFTVEWKNQ